MLYLIVFRRYKKIHCIVVRGAYFCPSAVDCLSKHLNVSKNSMIMGVPDAKFPFPFAMLRGVRLAVPQADSVSVDNTNNHLRELLGDAAFHASMKGKASHGGGMSAHDIESGVGQGGLDGDEEDMVDISQLRDDSEDPIHMPPMIEGEHFLLSWCQLSHSDCLISVL